MIHFIFNHLVILHVLIRQVVHIAGYIWPQVAFLQMWRLLEKWPTCILKLYRYYLSI